MDTPPAERQWLVGPNRLRPQKATLGGSDRVQVTFSQHRPPKVKDTLDHDHKSRGWLVERRRAFCFCVVPEIEMNSLLALSGMWSGREVPSPSPTPGGELAVWRGGEGQGAGWSGISPAGFWHFS